MVITLSFHLDILLNIHFLYLIHFLGYHIYRLVYYIDPKVFVVGWKYWQVYMWFQTYLQMVLWFYLWYHAVGQKMLMGFIIDILQCHQGIHFLNIGESNDSRIHKFDNLSIYRYHDFEYWLLGIIWYYECLRYNNVDSILDQILWVLGSH